jgi:hypothetical protein
MCIVLESRQNNPQRRDIINTYLFQSMPSDLMDLQERGGSRISLHGSLVPRSLARMLS